MKPLKSITALLVEIFVFVSCLTVAAILVEYVFVIEGTALIMFIGLAVGIVANEITEAGKNIVYIIFDYRERKKKPPMKEGGNINRC